LGDRANQDALFAAKWACDLKLVAHMNRSMRLGRLPVHLHLAALARPLRVRPGLEQAGDVEPDVDADRGE
jgi:hypothetical protein